MSGQGGLLGLKYAHLSAITIPQEGLKPFSHHDQNLLLIDSQYWQSFQTPQPEMKQLHPKVEKQYTVPTKTTIGNKIRNDKLSGIM